MTTLDLTSPDLDVATTLGDYGHTLTFTRTAAPGLTVTGTIYGVSVEVALDVTAVETTVDADSSSYAVTVVSPPGLGDLPARSYQWAVVGLDDGVARTTFLSRRWVVSA